MATLWLLLLLIPLLDVSSAERQLQETISMTEDGWRPIVGVGPRRRNPEGHNHVKAVDIEIVRSESPVAPTQPPEETSGKNRNAVPENSNKNQVTNQKPKLPPHAKVTYHTIPNHHFVHSNGVAVSRPSQFGVKKQGVKVASPSPFFGSKRKPPRGPAASHSIRNEVYVQAGLGSSNLKVREAQGLGQPTRFASHPGPIFQQFKSQPLYIFTQTASQNDVYSKNLVPPPPPPPPPAEAPSKIRFADGATKHFDLRPQLVLENLVAEPVKFKSKEPAVTDVQVTKENLKVFHDEQRAPDYVDYDFHSVTSRPQQHKWQTYEVTEGKWVDSPTPYVFDFVQQQPPPRRPRPREPLVELNVPQFLPTPYKPDGVVPTSATQGDVSTVFSQVSAKIKPHHQRQPPPPHLFDVKEVSTHYPILGKPAFVTDLATDNPVAMTENSETVTMTTTTTTEEAVRKTKGRRRRPQPRRPTSTSTTEEPSTEAATSTEAERTRKRQRLRPYAYKTSYEDDDGFATTAGYASEEMTSTEKITRGRNRYRNRGGNGAPPNSQQYFQQKRLNPSINKQGTFNTGLVKQTSREEETERPQAQQDLEEELKEFAYEKTSEELPTVKIEEVTETTTKETPQESVTQESDQFTLPSTLEQTEEEATTPMVPETTTTVAATSTTAAAMTVKPTKVRTKLHKLNAANRPRFSVKDYRQRLTQYVSSTAPTTASTDFLRTTYEPTRLRFPSRLRTRPSAPRPSPSPTAPAQDEQDTEPTLRRRFKPKDPRHSTSTTTEPGEPSPKPYRNYRQKTTEQPTKVSIRPNLFSAKRRSPLTHKPNVTTEETKNEMMTTTTTTEETVDRKGEEDDEYTKRISELTSSVQNEPGMFKSVASSKSRMVPNHFTIATEDPILPIEAFFTNINEKE